MAPVSIARILSRALRPLRITPFHPQWHVERHARRLSRLIGRDTSGLIVDIGCGRMEIRNYLLPERHHYIGLDYPPTSDGWYKTRPQVYGDGHQIPFRSDCADAVLLTNVLEHLRYPEKCISEVHRVLKDGGQCIAEVPFLYPVHDAPLDFSRWTRHGLEDLFRRNGLRIASISPVGKPAETSVLLLNLAIAHGFVRFFSRKNPLLILAPALPAIFLVLNVISYLLAAMSKSEFMPYSYWIIVTKYVDKTSD